MCIVIVNQKNNTLSKKVLRTCAENNPDSFGLMFHDGNKIVTYKTLNAKDFINSYYHFKLLAKNEMILHFRIATAGLIDINNCHPFEVSPNLFYMHNGIISEHSHAKSMFSDSYLFNERILKKLPLNFLDSQGCIELISKYVEGSKLVFLWNDEVRIINEHLGITASNGNWFSNSSYKSFELEYDYRDWQYYGYDGFNSCNNIQDLNQHCDLCGNILVTDVEIEEAICIRCAERIDK